MMSDGTMWSLLLKFAGGPWGMKQRSVLREILVTRARWFDNNRGTLSRIELEGEERIERSYRAVRVS